MQHLPFPQTRTAAALQEQMESSLKTTVAGREKGKLTGRFREAAGAALRLPFRGQVQPGRRSAAGARRGGGHTRSARRNTQGCSGRAGPRAAPGAAAEAERAPARWASSQGIPPRPAAHRIRVGVEVLEGQRAEHKAREHRRRALSLHAAATTRSGGRGRGGRACRPDPEAARRGGGEAGPARGGAGAGAEAAAHSAYGPPGEARAPSVGQGGARPLRGVVRLFGEAGNASGWPPAADGPVAKYPKLSKRNAADRIKALLGDIVVAQWMCNG